jgi:hypothetical protein
MLNSPRDHETVNQLQSLLNATFEARDELYVVAQTLGQSDQSRICRWLGDRLGGHAATLQQIIAASGARPNDPRSTETTASKLEAISQQRGAGAVLNAAEQTEHALTEKYDQVIELIGDREIIGLLKLQRREADIADCILRSLGAPV